MEEIKYGQKLGTFALLGWKICQNPGVLLYGKAPAVSTPHPVRLPAILGSSWGRMRHRRTAGRFMAARTMHPAPRTNRGTASGCTRMPAISSAGRRARGPQSLWANLKCLRGTDGWKLTNKTLQGYIWVTFCSPRRSTVSSSHYYCSAEAKHSACSEVLKHRIQKCFFSDTFPASLHAQLAECQTIYLRKQYLLCQQCFHSEAKMASILNRIYYLKISL